MLIAGARVTGRDPAEVETWEVAALDCHRNGAKPQHRIGAILAFMAAGHTLQGDLSARAVPAELASAVVDFEAVLQPTVPAMRMRLS